MPHREFGGITDRPPMMDPKRRTITYRRNEPICWEFRRSLPEQRRQSDRRPLASREARPSWGDRSYAPRGSPDRREGRHPLRKRSLPDPGALSRGMRRRFRGPRPSVSIAELLSRLLLPEDKPDETAWYDARPGVRALGRCGTGLL